MKTYLLILFTSLSAFSSLHDPKEILKEVDTFLGDPQFEKAFVLGERDTQKYEEFENGVLKLSVLLSTEVTDVKTDYIDYANSMTEGQITRKEYETMHGNSLRRQLDWLASEHEIYLDKSLKTTFFLKGKLYPAIKVYARELSLRDGSEVNAEFTVIKHRFFCQIALTEYFESALPNLIFARIMLLNETSP